MQKPSPQQLMGILATLPPEVSVWVWVSVVVTLRLWPLLGPFFL